MNKKILEQQKNTIAFKRKYKVSPNFVAFSLLIAVSVGAIPYYLSILRTFSSDIARDIWPTELWILAFAYPVVFGIILHVMDNKYETSIKEFSKKINKLKFLKMFR
ncbi:MAG: hypothetical protein QF460_01240 [Candidatus Nanoarchaeia archaeon]|jgi:hypothetical protein|nr:hypothetical protein [Candidatus Nanoarchaeia archaeon]|tara:strand:+ start:858 stop:1175 length:318 start_codon:yes stop_codon:yes gene_type:complete